VRASAVAPCRSRRTSATGRSAIALAAAAYEEYGHVDVLVNNAGMSPLYPSLDAVEEALFDKIVAVNLKGPFRLVALFGTRMAAGAGGSIINISSVGAIRPNPAFLPYAAAKAGINALTEGFARAYGPTVRVNAIMAGMFATDIAKAWDRPAVDAYARTSFAPEASIYCTGAILRLDGRTP
jgi:NAD(P)-dependent dehydrogenase (short-subunit alcohol dehydrogenase family)